MPKIKPLIPSDYLLENLNRLSGDIQIIPEQAGMILGISTSQLETNRKDGEPPPFVKQGGSYRYRIEDVRNCLASNPIFDSVWAVDQYERQQVEKGFNFGSFDRFLNQGGWNDRWAFTVVKGKPIEFFASLIMSIDEESAVCRFLTLGDYLQQRRDWELQEIARKEAEAIAAVIDKSAQSSTVNHDTTPPL